MNQHICCLFVCALEMEWKIANNLFAESCEQIAAPQKV